MKQYSIKVLLLLLLLFIIITIIIIIIIIITEKPNTGQKNADRRMQQQ